MSKDYNILEAIKMPIGTEFEVVNENGEIEDTKAILISGIDDSANKILAWNGCRNYPLIICDTNLQSKFIVVEKPVSFIEAIKAYTNGKDIMCEHNGGCSIYKNKYCEDNCVNILYDDYGDGISAEEILNGEWYID